MESLVVSLFGSLIIAVVAAVVTVRLSLSNFYSQKWWEKKAEVYFTLIESLGDIRHGIELELRALVQIFAPDQQKLIGRVPEAEACIARLSYSATFVVSDDVPNHLRRLGVARARARESAKGPSYEEIKALQEAIDAIRECGTRELQGRTWWKRVLCG